MEKIPKLSSYVLYGLLIISTFLTVLMLFGGVVSGDLLETPTFTDEILNWAYLLVALALIIVVGFEIYGVAMEPSEAKKSLYSAGGIVLLSGLSYMLADGVPLEILGYEGSDNIPSILKIVDVGLFSFYALMVVAIISILVSEISRFSR